MNFICQPTYTFARAQIFLIVLTDGILITLFSLSSLAFLWTWDSFFFFLQISGRSITPNKWTLKVKRALILLFNFISALSSRPCSLSMVSMIFPHNVARNCMPEGKTKLPVFPMNILHLERPQPATEQLAAWLSTSSKCLLQSWQLPLRRDAFNLEG